MENETVDYGKVTGTRYSTESFSAVLGLGSALLSSFKAVKCGVQYCHNPDAPGNGNQQVP